MTLGKGQILTVDDTPANLEVIDETLSDAGYDVVTALDGYRALKRLQSYQPDLILLDIQMPGIDGFETCRRIKSDPATAEIPIIFITAFSDIENKVTGFSLGGVDYITKPFQASEMLARIDTHLRLRRLNQSLEREVWERTIKLESALQKLQKFQLQLVQHEKMATLGNLIAGVAHEINNPIGFIGGNLNAMRRHIQDLLAIIALYQENASVPDAIIAEIEDIDPNFIKEDFPKLIASMQLGCDRIHNISTSLRTFSRMDTDAKIEFNLHEGLDSTLLILKYRLKDNEQRPAIKIVKNYGDIPAVKCYPGKLNQVFMNLLTNAIDALDESNAGKTFAEIETPPNWIALATELSADKKSAVVRITDNGIGMSEEIKAKIFEQGFTTKEVGKGTGLGMAIARQIVEEKHGGTITCSSDLGKGTEFILTLPLS